MAAEHALDVEPATLTRSGRQQADERLPVAEDQLPERGFDTARGVGRRSSQLRAQPLRVAPPARGGIREEQSGPQRGTLRVQMGAALQRAHRAR